MNTNDNTERLERIFGEIAKMLQESDAAEGMSNFHRLLECLFIIHKKLVAAFHDDGAGCKQKLLNLIMLHVLSPYEDDRETRESMAKFALLHRGTCDVNVEVNKKDRKEEV